MSETTPFVLPTGISLAIGGNSLVIKHAGDVILEQTLGRKLSRVEAGGDLSLRLAPITGVLRAGGTLTVDGDVDAQELRGATVVIGAVKVRARAIVANEKVVIGKAVLAVDVIVAPEVEIDPGAHGRVRIVDCLNELAPSRVRGCLSLQDYEADFGGAAEFLAKRGVTPVTPLAGNLESVSMPEDPPSTEPLEEDLAGDDPPTDATVLATDGMRALVEEESEEDLDELPSDAIEVGAGSDALDAIATLIDDDDDDEEPSAPPEAAVVEEAPPPPSAPAARPTKRPRRSGRRPGPAKIRKAVARITAGYDDDLPPAAQRVVELSEAGDYDTLADDLDTLWGDLLRHHGAVKTQPPRTTIFGFHQLHSSLS